VLQILLSSAATFSNPAFLPVPSGSFKLAAIFGRAQTLQIGHSMGLFFLLRREESPFKERKPFRAALFVEGFLVNRERTRWSGSSSGRSSGGAGAHFLSEMIEGAVVRHGAEPG